MEMGNRRGPARALIVNADDLGYDPAIDRGILEAALRGIVTSATLLVTTPFAPDAARLTASAPTLGVGLHLNLARGPSLSRAPSLLGPDGDLSEALAAGAAPEDVASEARAQLARFVELMRRRPTHVDVHRHLHRHPAVLSGLVRVAREGALPVRSIDPGMRGALRARGIATPDAFVGDAGADPYWTRERLLLALAAIGPGITELMCHPGFPPERTRTSYGTQRAVELAALTHPDVIERVRSSGLKLASFRDLAG